MIDSKCPACGSLKSVPYDNFIVAQEDGYNILPSQYKLLFCSNCSLIFKNNLPNSYQLDLYYNSLSSTSWDYKGIIKHEIEIQRLILNYTKAGDSILDFGCSIGRLLSPLATTHKCYGIEKNLEAHPLANAKGIEMLGSDIEDLINQPKNFKIITLIDVYEHLINPIDIIEKLLLKLEPEGMLIIFTGHSDSFISKITKSYFWYIRLAQHLILLNKNHIKWMQKRFPNTKISFGSRNHFNFNINQFINELSWHLKWRFFSPNSPFALMKLNRYNGMKFPFQTSSWQDHYLIKIKKLRND